MHTQSPHRVRAPQGLAFPVHELVFVRAWAEGRGLGMQILLDQVLDGVAFEEMLLVRCQSGSRHMMTLWRVAECGVVAQVEGGVPHVFGGIHAALSHAGGLLSAKPVRVSAAWRRWFRRGAAEPRLPRR